MAIVLIAGSSSRQNEERTIWYGSEAKKIAPPAQLTSITGQATDGEIIALIMMYLVASRK